jgi:hypothetical protein
MFFCVILGRVSDSRIGFWMRYRHVKRGFAYQNDECVVTLTCPESDSGCIPPRHVKQGSAPLTRMTDTKTPRLSARGVNSIISTNYLLSAVYTISSQSKISTSCIACSTGHTCNWGRYHGVSCPCCRSTYSCSSIILTALELK